MGDKNPFLKSYYAPAAPSLPVYSDDDAPNSPVYSDDDAHNSPVSSGDDAYNSLVSSDDDAHNSPVSSDDDAPNSPVSSDDDASNSPVSSGDELPNPPVSTPTTHAQMEGTDGTLVWYGPGYVAYGTRIEINFEAFHRSRLTPLAFYRSRLTPFGTPFGSPVDGPDITPVHTPPSSHSPDHAHLTARNAATALQNYLDNLENFANGLDSVPGDSMDDNMDVDSDVDSDDGAPDSTHATDIDNASMIAHDNFVNDVHQHLAHHFHGSHPVGNANTTAHHAANVGNLPSAITVPAPGNSNWGGSAHEDTGNLLSAVAITGNYYHANLSTPSQYGDSDSSGGAPTPVNSDVDEADQADNGDEVDNFNSIVRDRQDSDANSVDNLMTGALAGIYWDDTSTTAQNSDVSDSEGTVGNGIGHLRGGAMNDIYDDDLADDEAGPGEVEGYANFQQTFTGTPRSMGIDDVSDSELMNPPPPAYTVAQPVYTDTVDSDDQEDAAHSDGHDSGYCSDYSSDESLHDTVDDELYDASDEDNGDLDSMMGFTDLQYIEGVEPEDEDMEAINDNYDSGSDDFGYDSGDASVEDNGEELDDTMWEDVEDIEEIAQYLDIQRMFDFLASIVHAFNTHIVHRIRPRDAAGFWHQLTVDIQGCPFISVQYRSMVCQIVYFLWCYWNCLVYIYVLYVFLFPRTRQETLYSFFQDMREL